jgi:hypothetical protein
MTTRSLAAAVLAQQVRITDAPRQQCHDPAARTLECSVRYARHADAAGPNPYPRECWPSAEDFRVILYAAGRYDGESGARLFDRIPDGVLRLFGEIEFAAGIAGLAQIGSITREQLRGH